MAINPVETFLQEAEELLAEIESAALSLDSDGPSEETINRLFRSFHTIKGSSGMCGLEAISGFTHHVESLLDKVRAGGAPASPDLATLLLKARDHIKLLLEAEQGAPGPPEGAGDRLVQEIAQMAGDGPPAQAENPGACAAEQAGTRTAEEAGRGGGDAEPEWLIRFRPNPAMLATGGRPLALLKDLKDLGPCEAVAHLDRTPALDAIQPDLCYLWWSIRLRTACGENAIRDVFIFVEDGSELDVERVVAAPQPAPEAGDAKQRAGGSRPAAASPTPAGPARAAAREATVRVPSNRLDRLVNLVGELVMNHSRLAQAASLHGAAEFANPVQELERLVAELRDNVLGIRMLPIGTLFGRFRRLVHDLSAELGKEADLVTEGAETELDKSILDQLGDPLVHCLRNCLDHGVEPPEEREAKGKPRRGTIRLAAMHAGSDVVVSISDDGRGVDRASVRAKAVERGLIAPDAVLNDKEIFNLLLLPGFSTARKVTNVSGRGVGMDVVKRQIDALRGGLTLASEAGRSTVVSITLPLTLAIIDGLLVQVGADQFIVPMAAVTENVELPGAQRARNNGRNVIAVRGDLVPYIDLRRTFQIPGAPPPIEKVVIVRHEEHRVGLVVDCVLGTHQTVIQSLGKVFRNVEVVSGATIMGDGRVVLILDVAAAIRYADAGETAVGVVIPPVSALSQAALLPATC